MIIEEQNFRFQWLIQNLQIKNCNKKRSGIFLHSNFLVFFLQLIYVLKKKLLLIQTPILKIMPLLAYLYTQRFFLQMPFLTPFYQAPFSSIAGPLN